jgi:hypothetical protein
MGQEADLVPGTEFVRRAYEPWSPQWDHDHCSMCGAKLSATHDRGSIDEGYATTATYARGAGYEWVCPPCFDDFAEEFGWQLIG